MPGRSREFAFEKFTGFDADKIAGMRGATVAPDGPVRFYGFDRDAGAIRMSEANADRAGVSALTQFGCQPISALEPPEGPPGLVMANPPYGARIGNKKLLYGLYASMGTVLKERFTGWRVGLVTSEAGLARTTGLRFAPHGAPVSFGGLNVRL
jgi:putative N6-adenine-specific DNA methylase